MNKLDVMASRCDEIVAGLREVQRYNRGTVLIFRVLWGIGLPLALLASIIFIGTRV